MKKFISFFSLFFILILISLIFNPGKADAAGFSQTYIRLDRQKAQTPTTGLACAKPVSSGVENNVNITFPSDFIVSDTLSDWTVTTSNLPSDATAWPGIGTANNISGQTVRFPSSDLTPGTLYCFRWNNSQALKTSNVGESLQGNITTKTLSNITIDSAAFALAVIDDDQIAVTASVDPLANTAELEIRGDPNTSVTLSQDKEIKITISYRHSLDQAYPMEIFGAWEQGLIDGSVSNYIDIYDYVVGSGTTTDNGTPPVVDLVNRRITWNIASVAPSANYREVSFKLKVKSDIPTDRKITAKVKAGGKIANSTLGEKSLTYIIQKQAFASPTPSLTPPPSRIIPLRFNYVRVNEVAQNYINTEFQTNRPTTYTLVYGENPNAMTQKITGLTFLATHKVNLPDLKPNTQYYFRITAVDRQGNTITSDIFTVTTASGKEKIKLNRDDFTVFWRKYFLLSQTVDTLVIPKSKPVTITVRIGDSTNFYRIKALFRNNNVLGIYNIDPAANIEETPLVEILPGILSGEIQAPSTKGIYTIDFELTDITGGKYTKFAPYKFYVSDPLTVIDKKTKKPIENATVKILKYEEGLKQFTPLINSFSIQSRTNQKGELDVILPTGIYNIEIKSPRHKSVERRVELGISSLNYPKFELEQDNTFMAYLKYYQEEVNRFWGNILLSIQDFFSSPNNKDLFLIFSILFLISLVLLNLHLRKPSGMVDRVMSFSILDILEFLTILSGLFFIKFLGIGETRDLAISTLIIFALGALYIRRAFFRRKK